MRVRLEGAGGPSGWPVPGCRCASCGRVAGSAARAPTAIVLDERVRLALSECTWEAVSEDYLAAATPDGCAITGPDGGRLLCTDFHEERAGSHDVPHDVPAEPSGAQAFDLVLIDLLDRPERLGDLRRRGLVVDRTQVIAVHLDHRIPSETELARRLAYWGARAVPDGTVLETGWPAPVSRPAPRRTLLLGGSRSGKSQEAELRLAAEPEVTYVATGPSGVDDPSWLARVRAHRTRRPAHWRTVETVEIGYLPHLLLASTGVLLVDGLGTWITAVFDQCAAWPGQDGNRGGTGPGEDPLDRVAKRCDELVEAWRQTTARVVAVSDEVGMGVVPATASGRLFRDTLGRLNQRLAAESEEVALVVAGRILPL